MAFTWRKGKFSLVAVVLQVLLIVLFSIFVEYDYGADARYDYTFFKNTTGINTHGDAQKMGDNYYPMFQDVHVMMFIGFGFLMTYMRRYSYTSVAMNMFVAAFVIQWATLVNGFFHLHDGIIQVNIVSLFLSDFAAAAVLISFGAVLGRLSPLQMLIMALLEIVVFTVNEWIGLYIFEAVDVGGSMFVHVFGAYFGIAMSAVLYRRKKLDEFHYKNGPSYHSDLFSMVGTVFLWLFWPSFNSALASGDDQQRAVINTYFAMAASCMVTFAFSACVSKDDKFEMDHIQNATLAGGVAVGTVADMMLQPWGAMLIGAMAGTLSVLGYKYIEPFLAEKLHLHDTCGVNNLHGMPGIMAGVAGVILSKMADQNLYGPAVYQIFPARVPEENTTAYTELSALYTFKPGLGRTAEQQAIWQLIALAVTLGMAIVGGIITGLVLLIPCWNTPPDDALFEDYPYWELPGDQPPDPHELHDHDNGKQLDVIVNEHTKI